MLILGAVLALGQAAQPPTRPDVRPPLEPLLQVCQAVAVSSPQAPKRRGSFSATKILDLQLSPILRNRPAGEHVLNLKIYTPKGHLYQQIDLPFRGDARRATGTTEEGQRTRRVDGYPQPLPEQELQVVRTSVGRGYQVSTLLPVAGTSIMTSSLYGKWKVVPHLDGNRKACGQPTVFTITQ